MQPGMEPLSSGNTKRAVPVVIFVLLAVAGVFYAKWEPYFLKAFVAAAHHSIGTSIIMHTANHAPAVGWSAALSYSVTYFKAIWIALVVGLVIGAGVQTLLPKTWLLRVLGSAGWKSAALAAVASVPAMM